MGTQQSTLEGKICHLLYSQNTFVNRPPPRLNHIASNAYCLQQCLYLYHPSPASHALKALNGCNIHFSPFFSLHASTLFYFLVINTCINKSKTSSGIVRVPPPRKKMESSHLKPVARRHRKKDTYEGLTKWWFCWPSGGPLPHHLDHKEHVHKI